MKTLWLGLLLCAGAPQAADRIDSALFATAVALHVIDLGQTLDIENHPELIETNPVLGRNPSKMAIYASCIAKVGVDYLAFKYLSTDWRRFFLTLDLGMTAQGTYSNSRVGVNINF